MDVSLATFWTRVNFLAPWVAVFPVLFQNKRWKGLKRAQKDTKGSKQRKQRWFGVMFRFECLCFARMSHTWHSTQNILESFTSVVLHSTQAFELQLAPAWGLPSSEMFAGAEVLNWRHSNIQTTCDPNLRLCRQAESSYSSSTYYTDI